MVKAHNTSRVAVLAMLAMALFAGGCAKKTARATPAVLVPTIEAQPAPAEPPAPDTQLQPVPLPESTPPAPIPAKPQPKPHKPVVKKPPQQQQQPPAAEQKPAPKPPDNSAQITADVPRAAVITQKQQAMNLLHDSDTKLNRVTRSLNDTEQGMMRQARNYIAQSNQALQGGDIERAYNLAVKANLLANELAK